MVAYGDMERENNKQRVRERMKARVSEGYWVIGSTPLGYKETAIGGVKEPSYPAANIVKRILEGYAVGSISTYEEIARIVNAEALIDHKRRRICFDGDKAKALLKRVWFYAGFVECPSWGISRINGKHRSIVSVETLEQVEARMSGKPVPRYRKDRNVHFPLRGHLVCEVCQGRLSGGR